MQTRRLIIISAILLLFPLAGPAQERSADPAGFRGDFGSKFFADLRNLFGRLQQAELDRAFQRATAVRCSELVSQKGEWKPVAFLNDDRKLGDWHYDSIEEVKKDLISYVFSGVCRGESGPVKVATSYPVAESLRRYRNQGGRMALKDVVIKNNDPVSVTFDSRSDTYTFVLPYLYDDSKENPGSLYSLTPPLTSSKPDEAVSLEFRCKALSGAELTYRFMLCRNRVVNRDPHAPERGTEPRTARRTERPTGASLGNAAYYIFSDGKEANSSVKLTFGAGVDPPPAPDSPAILPAPAPLTPAAQSWKPADPGARLVAIAGDEFRLNFNPATWRGRMEKPQWLSAAGRMDGASATGPDRPREYCAWQPAPPIPDSGEDSRVYGLSFRKDLQSVVSASVDVESGEGRHLGTLQCFFPQARTPAELTVQAFTAIAGRNITLEIRGQ